MTSFRNIVFMLQEKMSLLFLLDFWLLGGGGRLEKFNLEMTNSTNYVIKVITHDPALADSPPPTKVDA